MKERLKDLQVTPQKPVFDKPSTILLIIGESESRDYMSAFSECEYDTTPWLKAKKEDPHFLLFPNSYSCIAHTVSCLERALTEFNQYNDKQFYTSCSIIDIAHKAGYTTSWYSNQGHLGCADTPVTLVANTSQTAKWTKQNLNQVQYDEALLEYLEEVNPQKNNFVVIHLKGNHFNFINRYPSQFTKWGTPGNMT
jgi:heptose-I-phosphate ethanolaminephosphotransferase